MPPMFETSFPAESLAARHVSGFVRANGATIALSALVVGGLAWFALYAAQQLTNGHNWGDDFGLYLQLADNLRQGRPYNWLNRLITVPPGFRRFVLMVA